jgi:hypothetical protein
MIQSEQISGCMDVKDCGPLVYREMIFREHGQIIENSRMNVCIAVTFNGKKMWECLSKAFRKEVCSLHSG